MPVVVTNSAPTTVNAVSVNGTSGSGISNIFNLLSRANPQAAKAAGAALGFIGLGTLGFGAIPVPLGGLPIAGTPAGTFAGRPSTEQVSSTITFPSEFGGGSVTGATASRPFGGFGGTGEAGGIGGFTQVGGFGGLGGFSIPLPGFNVASGGFENAPAFGGGSGSGVSSGIPSFGGLGANLPVSGGGRGLSLGSLLNLKGGAGNIASLFGIGGGPGGSTTALSVLGSSGVLSLGAAFGGGLLAFGHNQAGLGHTAQASLAYTGGGALVGAKLLPQFLPGLTPAGGALAGAGIGLFTGGLSRGGALGALQTTVGGALTGFTLGTYFGGPVGGLIGAGIGAAAGLASGITRLFVSSKTEQMVALIKQVYGIGIPKNNGIIAQAIKIADEQFGGSIHAAVYSQPVRQLLQLYALSTGQNQLARGLIATPVAAQFANQGGKLTTLPSYFNGAPVNPGDLQARVGTSYLNPAIYGTHSQYSLTPIPFGGANTYGVPQPAPSGTSAPGAQAISLQLDPATTAAILQGQAAQFMSDNPRAVSTASNAGLGASAGRRDNAALVLAPNFLSS